MMEIDKYSFFYLQYILERVNFYDSFVYVLIDCYIFYILLLYYNLSSVLFFGDLIVKFKEEGWEVVDVDEVFQDFFFSKVFGIYLVGESLVWLLVKEMGEYEVIFWYFVEDSQYEILKMEKFGL